MSYISYTNTARKANEIRLRDQVRFQVVSRSYDTHLVVYTAIWAFVLTWFLL